MDIEQAKKQIKNAMKAYFTKDEYGNYKIPIEKQRPVLLIGPPGIGKTAIMEQIASELGVGLVVYSMTHHTRQSALGLPYITDQEYEGMEYRLSRYTMSEIIGSIYDLMKETGVKEGILFLDEINCVSETLAPCMLQFLQYKVFGQHQIPNGWIVVTAGNPPEYNKSVRDFDVVTWDRLKKIVVEPNYDVWKKYAGNRGVHPAITTYLSARKRDFYKIESTVDGKSFVTARGWDDLSEMIKLYEENGIEVDELLIGQYLQDQKISKDFAIYYDLFNKYRNDYKIEAILAGKADDNIIFRARRAPIDERLSLLGLLFDAVTNVMKAVCEKEDMLDLLTPLLRKLKAEFLIPERSDTSGATGKMAGAGTEKQGMTDGDEQKPFEVLSRIIGEQEEILDKGRRASAITPAKQKAMQHMLQVLEAFRKKILIDGIIDGGKAFELIKMLFEKEVDELKKAAKEGADTLENAFAFCEKAFCVEEKGDDEMLVFVTELTVNYFTARFIGHYGCEKYNTHNKALQLAQRQMELADRAAKIEWNL